MENTITREDEIQMLQAEIESKQKRLVELGVSLAEPRAACSGSALRSGPDDGTSPTPADATLASMTQDEYNERKRVLDEYVDKYVNMRHDLSKQWCLQAPFQPGDKVRLFKGDRVADAFVHRVNPASTLWAEYFYVYDFKKCKKDGTQGSNAASIYYADRIELLEKATSNS